MIKAILLDVDDTLLDFEACSIWAMNQAAIQCGIEEKKEMYTTFKRINDALWYELELGKIQRQDIFDTRWNRIFKELDIDYDGIAFEKEFIKYLHTSHIPVHHASEIINYLKSKYDLYIISNALYNEQVHRLYKAGLLNCFKGVFVSELSGYTKPDPQFFQYCLEKSGLTERDCIVIGDSLHADMQ
ncbi:MAG: HAD-IA family hydrolase, partial [Holdemanella sp.]|nr:HAD-IA family hydrolase [Holdemanella sp.]